MQKLLASITQLHVAENLLYQRQMTVYIDIFKIFQMAPQICSVYVFITHNMTERALQSHLGFYSSFFSKQLTSCFYHSTYSFP